MNTATLNEIGEHNYSNAVAHYTSPGRRDPVKVYWEEPFSIEVYRQAIACLGSPNSLSVLDVGCGTGDGLELISRALQNHPATASAGLSYVGIDNNPDMIVQARQLQKSDQRATFIGRDIREGVPECAFDLYLSCGVPYSHLTERELEAAITHIFAAIRRNQSRSAVIVDVLGRFSMEWCSNWARTRWPYRMSFFATDVAMGSVDMSFYTTNSLSGLIDRCAHAAGVCLDTKRFYDRSISVGRHTSTGEFNKALQPIRTYINSLYTDEDFDCSLLYLPAVAARGFIDAELFYEKFRKVWNATVRATQMRGGNRRELADSLRWLEHTMQPGLGVGHSLIGLVVADGRHLP